MPNEYNGDKLVLRDTSGNQMSLARFFQLALDDGNGHVAFPSQGPSSSFDPNHRAWDMGAGTAIGIIPARTPVCGTVVSASDGWNGGMGTHAIVEEENGRQHRFMHFAEGSLRVSVGSSVTQGDTLGLIGNTGSSEGAHLHYDAVSNGNLLSDPIQAYDSTTLPSGWNMNSAAAAMDWDYIPLDHTATDYGPPGGDVPSEPFFTDNRCYDISHPQGGSGNINACTDAIIAANGGGIIFGVGKIQNNGFVSWTSGYPSYHPDQAMQYAKGKIAIGAYFYNYADFGTDTSQAVSDAVAYITNAGLTPEDFPLGIWLDIDSEGGGPSGDPYLAPDAATNMINVKAFIDGFNQAGFITTGVYTTIGVMNSPKFNCAYSRDIPIWCAFIGTSSGSISFNDAGIDRIGRAYPVVYDYSKVYIHQYTWSETVPNWSGDLDGDKVCQPIPTSGGGGGGGGEYTEVIDVKVDIVPPKKIYFSPVPGIIATSSELLSEREAVIEVTTDADNANLYYTLDGSSPYQYIHNNDTTAYALAANALLYDNSITIHKDTHIRVVAVPSYTVDTFDEPLAKGSGTYLFAYQELIQDWESEQNSYAISDSNTSFFEENKQAFLRLHDQITQEEVLYSDPYKHDIQSTEENAKDNASTTDGTDSEDEPM